MAKQRMINTKFWSDPWVVDELNPLDRYLFLYLLTNEKTNIAGVYELSLRTMSNETGIEKEELLRMLSRLESRVVYVLGWVVFRNTIKHQNYRSPKIEVALARELREIPSDVLQYMDIPVKLGELLFSEYGIYTVSHLTKVTKVTKVTKPNAIVAEATQRTELIPTLLIQNMIDYWKFKVGMDVDTTANRRAIAALLRQKSLDEDRLKQLVDGVALSMDDRYAPRISDFVSLKRKMNDLILWGRKRNQASNVEVIS